MQKPPTPAQLTATAAVIIAARRAAGLSQADAARLIGLPRQTLNAWECARRLPRPRTLARVLKILAEFH